MVEVLDLFSESRTELTGRDVALSLGIARSSAYRYLESLCASGLVEETGSATFRLGPRVLELAAIARRGLDLNGVATPVLRALAAKVGETALLTRRSGDRSVCVGRADAADQQVTISYDVGHVMPLHAGAASKVLIAWLPDDELDHLAERAALETLTPATPTDLRRLRADLVEIREHGFAITRGEVDPGVCGIAVPLFDHEGRVVAGLSVAIPTYRLADDAVPGIIDEVRHAAVIAAQRAGLLATQPSTG
jgi:DNA-binding IclR family transcriptional regulator